VLGGPLAGLTHLRREAQIAGQLGAGPEPGRVSDRGEHCGCDGRIDAGNRHEAPRTGIIERAPGQLPIERLRSRRELLELRYLAVEHLALGRR
jgi:hypothetical protein